MDSILLLLLIIYIYVKEVKQWNLKSLLMKLNIK